MALSGGDNRKIQVVGTNDDDLGVPDGTSYQVGVTRGGPEMGLVATSDFAPPTWNPGSLAIMRADGVGNRFTRQSLKDVAAKALENTLDTIGLENVRSVMPFWEQSGSTFYDLMSRERTFRSQGTVTLGQSGLLGASVLVDGSTGYLEESPLTENVTGDTDDTSLSANTHKVAQKMVAFAAQPGHANVHIKKVGAPTGSIQLSIYSDSAGSPSAAVTNGTSNTLNVTNVGSSYHDYGFAWSGTLPTLSKGSTYWLVLEYAAGATVDGTNYIAIQYDSAGGYGQGLSRYDGTSWTASAGEDAVFAIYDDRFVFPTDFSVVFAVRNTRTTLAHGYAFLMNGVQGAQLSAELIFRSEGRMIAGLGESSLRAVTVYSYPTTWEVWALTFNYTNSTGKTNFYRNGVLVGSVDGTATTALSSVAKPVVFGTGLFNNSSTANFFQGNIGPAIFCTSELSATTVGKVTNQFLALRRYAEAV